MTYTETLQNQRAYFKAQHTKALSARQTALRSFKQMLLENEAKLYAAVQADFGKSEHEAFLTEWAILIKDIDEALDSLKNWTKPQKVRTNLARKVFYDSRALRAVFGHWRLELPYSVVFCTGDCGFGSGQYSYPKTLRTSGKQCTMHGRYRGYLFQSKTFHSGARWHSRNKCLTGNAL